MPQLTSCVQALHVVVGDDAAVADVGKAAGAEATTVETAAAATASATHGVHVRRWRQSSWRVRKPPEQ